MDVLAHFFKSYRSLCLAINVELNGWEKNYIQGYFFFQGPRNYPTEDYIRGYKRRRRSKGFWVTYILHLKKNSNSEAYF